MADLKRCMKCDLLKDRHSEFGRDSSRPDGRFPWCKKCRLRPEDPRVVIANERLLKGLKGCSKCSVVKPLSSFDRDSQKRTGYASSCKACQTAARRKTHPDYHDRVEELDRLFALGMSRCARCNAIKSLGEFLVSKTTRYKIFRMCKVCNVEYRDRRLPSKRNYTRSEVFEDDSFLCYLCENPVDMRMRWPHPNSPSIDHVVPIAHGGTDTRDNVRLACAECNMAKRDLAVDEFLMGLTVYSC